MCHICPAPRASLQGLSCLRRSPTALPVWKRGIVVLLVGALSSCAADKKAATKANFRAALQNAKVNEPKCLPLSFPEFLPQRRPPEQESKQVATLVKAGLVSAPHSVPVEQTMFVGWLKSGNAWAQPGLEYDLTTRGQKYQHTITLPLLKPQTELCYAEPEITGIERYTEPAPLLGQVMTHVTYDYELSHFAPWALDPAIVTAFHLQPDLDLRSHPKTAETVLFLTSDGWRTNP